MTSLVASLDHGAIFTKTYPWVLIYQDLSLGPDLLRPIIGYVDMIQTSPKVYRKINIFSYELVIIGNINLVFIHIVVNCVNFVGMPIFV